MKAFFDKYIIEAGCDEAGRGCLAGPVFAAAVILPKTFRHPYLNDSKKLSEQQRYKLRSVIEKKAVAYAVAHVTNEEIDKINIFHASYKAMHLALTQLEHTPDLLLVDGKFFIPYESIPYKCIIKGDGIYYSIAAASILAKTYRDDFMNELHHKYPYYKWNTNKGYPTEEHREGIANYGITPFHRRSYQLLPKQDIQPDLFEFE